MNFLKRTWAEISLDKAKQNFESIKLMAGSRMIMPIIKADAYGHGANTLAKMYQEFGAEAFAVSNINEAIKLRRGGVTKDILVLGYTPCEYIEQLYCFNITQTIYSLDYAKALSEMAVLNKLTIKTHIKIDTGMGRIGFNFRNEISFENSLQEVLETLKLPSLIFEGFFAHYATADNDNDENGKFTKTQTDNFNIALEKIKNNGYDFKYIHCCNSAGSALLNDNLGNLIRPGIILYGLSPSSDLILNQKLFPILSIKSAISHVKKISSGDSISYGKTFTATKDMIIATVPIGYADGYPRALSNKGKVIVNGMFANIVGRICMDQLMIDVTNIQNIEIGTEVTLVGEQNGLSITFDDLAKICNTISYELLCNISIRMPRVYIENNKILEVVYLGGSL